LHVGQGKGAFAVAPIGGAQKGEKGGVLANGEELAIAKSPTFGSKVERENPDLSYKLF
jgi:hypothetical protein